MSCSHDCGDYEDQLDSEDDTYWDCGLMPDGQCLKAGSEECDWDCPYSRGEFFAGSELWNKKHGAGLPVYGCECAECREAKYGPLAHKGEES